MCKRLDVFSVKIRGWLIQGKDATVQAECLGQGQANDEGGQYLEQRTDLFLSHCKGSRQSGLMSVSGKGSNVVGSLALGKSLLLYLGEPGTLTRLLNSSRR